MPFKLQSRDRKASDDSAECKLPPFLWFSLFRFSRSDDITLIVSCHKLAFSMLRHGIASHFVVVLTHLLLPGSICIGMRFPLCPKSHFPTFLLLLTVHKYFTSDENGKRSPKQNSIIYSFDRDSEQPVQKVSDLERKQFSSLHIRSPFDTDLLSDSPHSRRARSFPTTPEKGVRPTSSPALHPSYFGESQSLNSLTSSRTDMRFSRHMVSGGDIGDTEV